MKLKLTILTLLVALTATFTQAQKVVTIEGTYRYQQPADESFNVARSKAIDRARIQGLSQKFGTTVSSSSSTRVKDGKASFFQLGMNEVKGEWLGDVGEPVITSEIDPSTQLRIITARVKFKPAAFPCAVFGGNHQRRFFGFVIRNGGRRVAERFDNA